MSRHLNHVSNKIRKCLSNHLSLSNLKRLAFAVSLLSCLSAGSILLFSLFSISLHDIIGLSYFQINLISSVSAIGMYLCLPVLGYLSDCHGPALLSLISIWLFCPSYYINSLLVSNAEKYPLAKTSVYGFSITFGLIGLATSSLYFLSLLTCARIYPNHKGLAISLPVSCYGLSTFIGSQLLKLKYFKAGDYLDLPKTFNFFGALYLVVGVLNFTSSSIVTIEQEIIFHDESTPLLRDQEECGEEEVDYAGDENLLETQSSLEPTHHHERYKKFLLDKSSWFLLLSLILNIGSLESYQNNLGSIVKIAAPGTVLSNQVSIMAAASTVIRLVIGALSDYLASPRRRYPICRIWLLVGILLLAAVGQIGVVTNINFSIISTMNGLVYGALFTLYPTIVATVWGIDIMGSTWGSFMVAPAIGSVIYSLAYGWRVDQSNRPTKECLNSFFEITSLGMLISLVIIFLTWRCIWCKRRLEIF
ncbi:uncharacterized protein PRCAT00004476001 [Priceomyces carsonii]|uniref:uncharacterized protein n=1 Tax=Priceomyces carsonii TaxID=28549 RepID=UPI002EDB7676|nr:unnamed protein product [Priceomyces carsonii]